jgi:hypothetical protein
MKQTVVITVQGAGPDFILRLRRWLKIAWRGYGLRCTAIKPEVSHD